MSLFDSPTPPDPTQTANTQNAYNQKAAQSQQEINMVGQNTPFGSLSYQQTGTNADGTPSFTATTQYSPQVQALLQQGFTNAQNGVDPTATTNMMNGWWNQYQQPIFDQQNSNLDSKLAAQGITQGSEAYNNAQNLQARNQNDARTSFNLQSEPLAFNQAVQTAQLPAQMLAELTGSVNPGFTSTPTAQIQPANYSGLAEQNYQQQSTNSNNMLNGLFKLGGTIVGGAVGGPFGAALGGGLGSALGGSTGGNWAVNNPGVNGSAYYGPASG